MAGTPKPYKAYVSKFQISVGPISTTGSLVKIEKRDDTAEYKSVCPDCTSEPVQPKQTYVCASGHSHPMGELNKAKLINGSLVFVDKDEVAAAKQSDLQKDVLKLTVHPAAEFASQTYEGGGNSYVFVPTVADEYVATLVELVKDTSKAFIGICNLRNNEGLFRLHVWRDQLVVQKIAWPDEIHDIGAAPIEVDQELLAKTTELAKQFVDKIAQPFNAADYKSNVKAKLAAINDSLANGGHSVPVTPAPKSAPKSGLLDLLEAITVAS